MQRSRRLRLPLAALGIALAALAVRALWLPLERHRFDGHEADYLRAFLGEGLQASTRLYPLLALPYSWLGALWADPRLLLGVNIAAGVLTVGLGGLVVGRRFGARAGLLTAALLACSPTHVFWSASAYNVAIPQLLVVAACACPRFWGVPLYALACGMRVELALLAPAVALVGNPRTALGALGAGLAWPLMDTAPAMRPVWAVLPVNLRLSPLLGPFGSWVGSLVLLGAVRKESLPLLLAALWVHLVGACFDDYGSRHALFGAFALCAVVGSAPGWRRVLLVPAFAVSLYGCSVVAHWYYAGVPEYRVVIGSLPPMEGCDEVLDDPLLPDSHWNRRADWPEEACWGEEAIHRAWTSRSLQDRALRMQMAYGAEPIGVAELPGGPRVYHRLHR